MPTKSCITKTSTEILNENEIDPKRRAETLTLTNGSL